MQMVSSSSSRTPPRARGIPILGVLPQLRHGPLNFFLKMALEYGDVVQLDLGPARFYLVSHPDLLKSIFLDNQKGYAKGYDKAKPLLGEGLVTSEGDLWKRQRRLMAPLFQRQHLNSLLPIMAQATQEWIERLHARKNTAQPLDLAAEFMLLTQTIILRTMFSTDIGARAGEISAAFSSTLEYLNTILLSPISYADRLPTPTNRRFHRSLKYLDGIIYEMIEKRRANPGEQHDLLATLLTAKDEETGEGMSNRQLRDEVMTIFLAGHETTATLLTWTCFLLSRHPAEEAKVRAEFSTILAGRTAASDDIDKLTYTRQVLDEALRLYPPAWMFARQSVAENILGEFRIPARATLMISPYVTHRLPAFWEQPDRFDPARFTPENIANRPKFAYFPFGGGARTCIGSQFALMEAPLLLSMLMQNFRFDLVPDRPVIPQPVATLRPRNGLWMTLQAL